MRGLESPRRIGIAGAVVAATMVIAACRENPTEAVDEREAANSAAVERWYGIYMQGAKVGHSSTRERIIEKRGETLVETTTSIVLKASKGSDVVRMGIVATSVETPDGELRRFSWSSGTQSAGGSVADGQLTIDESNGGRRQLTWLPEFRGPHAWQKILVSSPPAPNQTRSFRAFDESILAICPQELVGGPLEETATPSGNKMLRRIERRTTIPDGQVLVAQLWIDAEGTCVKLLDGTTGWEFHLISRDAAIAPSEREVNLLDDTMVRLATPLPHARRTRWVRYRIAVERGDAPRLFAACPSQAVRRVDDRTVDLVVRAVRPDTNLATTHGEAAFAKEPQPADATYLKPNHYIAANDPIVAAMAREAAADATRPWPVALALERHVSEWMEQVDYSQAFLTAAEVAQQRKGDCSEYAVLLAALLRARGIPSRVAVGLVYVDRATAMGYHMWTEAWIDGRWVGLDATLGDGGIAADHIKVAATSLENGLADPALITLGQLLGARPRIEVVQSQLREP